MERLWKYKFQRSTLLLLGCSSFLIGVGVARSGFSVAAPWCVVAALFAAAKARKRSLGTVACYVLCGLVIGCWRGGVYLQKLRVYDKLYFQTVSLTVRALDDGVYGKK